MRKKVGITVAEDLHDQAQSYANETGRTFSGLVEVAIKQFMEGEKI